MSNVPPPNAATQVQYTQANSMAALMDCLCRLQEQNGFQQLSNAILASNLNEAQRAYRQLKKRVPRKPAATPAENEAPDPLDQAFAILGEALAQQDGESARQALLALQQAVQHASVHHKHDKPPSPGSLQTSDAVPSPSADGRIDIKV